MNKINSLVKTFIISTFLLTMPIAVNSNANAAVLDIGTAGTSGCCSTHTRGYWFVAPTNFSITKLSLPGNGIQDSTIQVVKLNATPPNWNSTTNNFTSMGFWENVASVTTNIAFSAGEIVGVLGWADGKTTYRNASGAYNTTLGGHNITLTRLGFQSLGMAQNIFQEPNGFNGMINMEYTTSNRVPEPAALGLLGFGLVGFALYRRKHA